MKKEPFTILETGYIAPNGDFYSCDYFEHLDTAEELLSTFYNYTTFDSEKELLEKGWISIHCLMSFFVPTYLFVFKGHLTPEQIHIIKPIVENNWERILKSNQIELKDEFER